MIDQFYRWCMYYDLEVTASPADGPPYTLQGLAADLLRRINAGLAVKTVDKGLRTVRIAQARRLELDQGDCLGFVMTVGNSTGASPSFIDRTGNARDADPREGEVRGGGCHGILRLSPTRGHPGRHLLILEQAPGLGRTILERMLNQVFADIAEERRSEFESRKTGKMVKVRPVAHISAHPSEEMRQAMTSGTLSTVELIDTTPNAHWEEAGEFKPKRRIIEMELVAPLEERQNALRRLMDRARDQGYDRLRLQWKAPGSQRTVPSEIATDLADLNEATFAKRALVHIEAGLSECSHVLREDFLEAIATKL